MKVLCFVLLAAICCSSYANHIEEWRKMVYPKSGSTFLANVLGSNMVLQRAPYKANIWGWTSSSGAQVAAVLNGKTYKTSSGSDNLWTITFDPMPAGGPYTIVITSSEGDKVTMQNVLFGDVWLCGGQSNMQFTVSLGFNASQEETKANDYPNIRVFTVGQQTTSETPLAELATIEQEWTTANQTSIGGSDWAYFSAVCWFYARNLYDTYQVPLGMISSNWGGTYVQAWSSPDALSKCKQTEEKMTISKVETFESQPGPNTPSVLWNAMIVPFLPTTVSGAIWYQGEANVGAAQYYACAFPAMITDWRAKFGSTAEDFGFFFVQLAAYTEGNPGTALADLRLAQTAALQLSTVGMATAIDLGDLGSPAGNIHPRDKQAVGERLSLAARDIYYGNPVQYLGPTYSTFTVQTGAPNVVVNVAFTSDSLGKGLELVEAYCPAAVGDSNCAWAEIQTSDNVWHNATQAISGNYFQLSVTVASGLQVTGVRYGYQEWPVATLFNKNGLPATPFYATTSK